MPCFWCIIQLVLRRFSEAKVAPRMGSFSKGPNQGSATWKKSRPFIQSQFAILRADQDGRMVDGALCHVWKFFMYFFSRLMYPICAECMEYWPTCAIYWSQNVGRYSIHGACGYIHSWDKILKRLKALDSVDAVQFCHFACKKLLNVSCLTYINNWGNIMKSIMTFNCQFRSTLSQYLF